MSFSHDELGLIADSEEVQIETRPPGGPPRRTTVWVVVDGGDVFVRSVRGSAGRWYREVLADQEVALHVDGRRVEARAARAVDPVSVERVSEALRRKYVDDPSLSSILEPDTLDTTIRLEPA